jgi:hypothetical protein
MKTSAFNYLHSLLSLRRRRDKFGEAAADKNLRPFCARIYVLLQLELPSPSRLVL